jgi:hypothetical protein
MPTVHRHSEAIRPTSMAAMCAAIATLIVLILSLATPHSVIAAPAAGPGDAKDLFNGKDLSGWDGDESVWSVQDGVITGRAMKAVPLKHNTFLIFKGGRPKDFELHAMYKISGGNSGILYRSKDLGDHIVSGYQADIVDADPDKYSGILYEERGRGIIAERGQKVVIDHDGKKRVAGSVGDAKEILAAIKHADWNEYVITARGNHLVQTINGHTTVDVTDDEPGKSAQEGIIALQIHAGFDMTVQFKDIRLSELKPAKD